MYSAAFALSLLSYKIFKYHLSLCNIKEKFFLFVLIVNGIVIMHIICLQVELFCVNNLINCSLESTEEFISMEFRFTLRDDGMRAAFQLLHMVLEVMRSVLSYAFFIEVFHFRTWLILV